MKNTPMSTFILIPTLTKIGPNSWKIFTERYIIYRLKMVNSIMMTSIILQITKKIVQSSRKKNLDKKLSSLNKNFQSFNLQTQQFVNKICKCKLRFHWLKTSMASIPNFFTKFWCSLIRSSIWSLPKKYKTNSLSNQLYSVNFIKDKSTQKLTRLDLSIQVQNNQWTLKLNLTQRTIIQHLQEAH